MQVTFQIAPTLQEHFDERLTTTKTTTQQQQQQHHNNKSRL